MPDAPPPIKPPSRRRLSGLMRAVHEAGPYVLALAVFVVTANVTLNPVAASYANQLFALALILMKTAHPPPPPS